MASKKTVVANMTIETGTPAKPRTVAKGEAFDIDADDPENLLGRGIATDQAPAPVLIPPAPIEIPDGWRDLPAADVIALAHKLGAGGEVAKKDDAIDYVAGVVAAREQLQL